eukprot:3345172-Lingulodinium_polyedra.AAC.1
MRSSTSRSLRTLRSESASQRQRGPSCCAMPRGQASAAGRGNPLAPSITWAGRSAALGTKGEAFQL